MEQHIDRDGQATPWRCRWIISVHDDLLWFVGSVGASYALLLLYRLLGVSALLLIVVWVIFFDGPHIFGTVTRTYFDAEMRSRKANVLYGSLVLFLIGPALALLPKLVPVAMATAQLVLVAGRASVAFIFVASMWAYYHIVMQHYGIMMLYKKKNDDLAEYDTRADRFFLFAMLLFPFIWYMLEVPDALEMWPVLPGITIKQVAEMLALLAAIAAAALFAGRQVIRYRRGDALDLPKMLFLGAVVPMHWAVLMGPLPPRVMVPILTISHNIQYQRLIWFHNRNKYAGAAGPKKYGWAALISRNALVYYFLGVMFATYRLPNAFNPDSDVLIGFLWGFSLVHYYLDGQIWQVRKDPELRNVLHLAAPVPHAAPSGMRLN
jgi:hypothetical protein